MRLLYSFLFSPARIIQLHTHLKDWRVWWAIIGISGLISTIKMSSLDLISIVAHVILILGWLIVTAIIIDSTAQLMGLNSELPTLLYWLGFSNTILWLSPSIEIIQNTFYSFGSVLIFILNLIFLTYIWVTLQKIYKTNVWKLIGLFFIPFISLIILFLSLALYFSQLAVIIK